MKYDESYDSPAPIAEIILRNPQSGERSVKVKALLDTGADISLLPEAVINQLKIEASAETVNLFGFDENQSIARLYNSQIIFLNKRVSGNYCVADDETAIPGRDVLNEFSILFDGINLEWSNRIK